MLPVRTVGPCVFARARQCLALDVQNESLAYTGQFSRPPLELWEAGGIIIQQSCKALEPYKVTLENFQVPSQLATFRRKKISKSSEFGTISGA